MDYTNAYVASNEAAWDRAAQTYADDIASDVAALQSGQTSLLPDELRLLGDLSDVERAIHLQCSHGLDALSLLQLGAKEVVGVDISQEMLAQASKKTDALGANARWLHSDILTMPDTLDGTADLVYTGKGALPWMNDIRAWAQVVARLLKPGGRLFVFEGHPLTWIWDPEKPEHRLRHGRGYFDAHPKANMDFPAAAVERYTPEGETAPEAWEWPWTLGQVVTAVAQAGLRIEHLEEHPNHFWDHFPEIPADEMQRLPHTYTLIARRPAE
ncbi:MAG: class I SAM-dependent methyltransferase [Rhodothermales bacterium]